MNFLCYFLKCFILLNYGNVRKYGIIGNFFNRFNKKELDDKFLVGEDLYGNIYYEKLLLLEVFC